MYCYSAILPLNKRTSPKRSGPEWTSLERRAKNQANFVSKKHVGYTCLTNYFQPTSAQAERAGT